MNSKTRYEILRALRAHKGRSSSAATGFTLVELMIVVAIVGILSALALPAFLRARDIAAIGAAMGEAIGISKECATSAASQLDVGVTPPVNPAITVGGSGTCVAPTGDGVTYEVNAVNFQPALQTEEFPAGIRCLNQITAGAETTATISIAPSGALSCSLA